MDRCYYELKRQVPILKEKINKQNKAIERLTDDFKIHRRMSEMKIRSQLGLRSSSQNTRNQDNFGTSTSNTGTNEACGNQQKQISWITQKMSELKKELEKESIDRLEFQSKVIMQFKVSDKLQG